MEGEGCYGYRGQTLLEVTIHVGLRRAGERYVGLSVSIGAHEAGDALQCCTGQARGRPGLLPSHHAAHACTAALQVPSDSRSQVWASFDGRDRTELRPGDSVVIRLSKWPVPTVSTANSTSEWFCGVREGLHWNLRKLQSGAGK